MILGDRVGLRALEVEDLPVLKEWRNKSHYRKFFREYQELTLEHQKNWFQSAVVGDHRILMFGIIDTTSAEMIGVCGLTYINWVHRHADLSLYIGKDDIYIDTDSTGWAWRTMDALLAYGFDELNLNKVWTEIYAFDEKKHTLFEAYGMHRDGVLRQNYFYDGAYQDSHVYSILAEEWRAQHTT